MYRTIQSIFDSITSKQASIVGCNLTVQTPDGEQISINVEPVQERPVQSESVQHSKVLQYDSEYEPDFRRMNLGKSRHTLRRTIPSHAKYSELAFDFFEIFVESPHLWSCQQIKTFFEVQQYEHFQINLLGEYNQDEIDSIHCHTTPKLYSRIIMILILKLYEEVMCPEHNPHPYFFVLKPLFQVNQKKLRNKYSERITTLVQYIASIEIDRIEPFVNLIFEFGEYVGEEFFVQTLHESRHYQVTGRSTSHIFNEKISKFIVDFFVKNPETNREAILKFGKPLNIW